MATSTAYKLGDYVQLTKKRKGFIRFQGHVKGVGDCYGIELDAKDLKNGNNGSMEGKQYFSTKEGFGTFVTKKRIVSILKTNPTKNGSIKKKKKTSKKRSKSPLPKSAKLKHTVTPRPHNFGQTNHKKRNSHLHTTKTNKKKSSKKTIISSKEYPKNGSKKEKFLFIFGELNTTKSLSQRSNAEIIKKKIDLVDKLECLLKETKFENEDESNVNDLVSPSFIVNGFKKIFEALLKDKKQSISRGILNIFNFLICASFCRQLMCEHIVFFMKPLMHNLTLNNSKNVNAAKESISMLINEVLVGDNKKMIKILFSELLRYSTSSKKKIIRKHCWMFLHKMLETKYKIQKAAKKELRPPDDVIGIEKDKNETIKVVAEESDTERVIIKKKKPSKSIMDALSNGLKSGLNDKDREVKVEAMKVLNLFSLLEETKADRLISKMSTSTRKLFDSKYGSTKNNKKSAKSAKKVVKKSTTSSAKKNRKKSIKTRKKRKSFSLKEDPESVKKSGKKSAKKKKKKSVKKKKKSNKVIVDDDKYALAEDEETKQNNVNLDEVRNRRRQRRGGSAKKRSESTFGTADDLDFDLSALGPVDDDNDDNDTDNVDDNEETINAGKDGDVRKESEENEIYSSSTETYEGDNIDIIEFPRKDVLDSQPINENDDFSIDIDAYLSNNNAEYNWKFGNEEMIFFSHKSNAHILMSHISQIDHTQSSKSENWIEELLDYDIDFDDLSQIKDCIEFWPTDIETNYAQLYNPKNENFIGDNVEYVAHCQHDFIIATQKSYNLMRLLTNEHQSDWIKQFIQECIFEICVHALCVFHPLSHGNVYHGRVILEVLLTHFPFIFLQYLAENVQIIQPLLKYAMFNNIHYGNLNSFIMDLICFDPESIQQRDDIMYHEKAKMINECRKYKSILLSQIFAKKWNFVQNIIKRSCTKFDDNVSNKYCVFFVDLVARCASIQDTKCLFDGNIDFIIESFINGLLQNDLSNWQRIRCGQSLIEYLDLASRPTIMDPSMASSPFGFLQGQNAYKENIFYASFKRCLSKLVSFVPHLCMLIIEECETKKVKFSYGDIDASLGRLKLTALELLTVTIDFHEIKCSVVLEQIPNEFWTKIIEMVFVHKNNNMFLCHFRRLIHLSMIFRRRILKYLCVECKMIDRMVDYYQNTEQRSELHGYILQMVNDIYCHDNETKQG